MQYGNSKKKEMSEDDVSWIVVPIIIGVLIYTSTALFVWPYARPVFSIWILLFSLLFPPAFFVVSTYIFVMFCVDAPEPTVIVVGRRRDAPVGVTVVGSRGRVRTVFAPRGGSGSHV